MQYSYIFSITGDRSIFHPLLQRRVFLPNSHGRDQLVFHSVWRIWIYSLFCMSACCGKLLVFLFDTWPKCCFICEIIAAVWLFFSLDDFVWVNSKLYLLSPSWSFHSLALSYTHLYYHFVTLQNSLSLSYTHLLH